MTDLQADGQTLVLTLKPLLHVTKGPNVGKFFEVHLDSSTSIGRAQGNDIVLDDLAVSSQHVRIRPLGGVYELIDLKSTNGTFVNERKIARTNLSAGDVVKIGETAMQFRMDHMKG
jgi:pSer/pThr/pTyr-binding forkhead associated (FHA) protein